MVSVDIWYFYFYYYIFKHRCKILLKKNQFEANVGISGGQIDGKSQFLFCFVKLVNIDKILDDVLMPFYSNSFYYGGEKFF